MTRRTKDLETGYVQLAASSARTRRPFPAGTYVMLHTLSHMLLQSLSARCGYPAASIRERIYVDDENQLYGILLYTSSPDAEGTLGGLVQQARHIGDHIGQALETGRLVLERSRLRAALGRRQRRGAVASRRGLPRLRPGRGDLVRDVERLFGPRPGRPDSRRARRCVLPRCGVRVTDALAALPAHLRRRLSQALDAGALAAPYSSPALHAALGHPDPGVLAALEDLARMGVTGRAAAAWIRALDRAASPAAKPDLVWSGPEVAGVHARDTRRVYEELFGSAKRSLWAVSYAYFDGPRVFDRLVRRMEAVPDLKVTLLLNIHRGQRDTSSSEHLVRRFRGPVLGEGLAGRCASRRVLRSKVGGPGGAWGYCTRRPWWPTRRVCSSRRRTSRRQRWMRTSSWALLVRYRPLAQSVVRHLQGLIDRGMLRGLPG